MGKVFAYKRQNLFGFRRNSTRNRKRNRSQGWQQQGDMSGGNQFENLFYQSGQFDPCRSARYNKGKIYITNKYFKKIYDLKTNKEHFVVMVWVLTEITLICTIFMQGML